MNLIHKTNRRLRSQRGGESVRRNESEIEMELRADRDVCIERLGVGQPQ
jgi:hypothetical protein